MGKSFCQSCGMPLSEGVLGTNADGSRNEDYCMFCYGDGHFLKECTMNEMIEHCSRFVDEVNKHRPSPLTREEYASELKLSFPHLKRWRKNLLANEEGEGIHEEGKGINEDCERANQEGEGINEDCKRANEEDEGIHEEGKGINEDCERANQEDEGIHEEGKGINEDCKRANEEGEGINEDGKDIHEDCERASDEHERASEEDE